MNHKIVPAQILSDLQKLMLDGPLENYFVELA
jgi:hypothetical protein